MGQSQFVKEECCCKKQRIPASRSIETDECSKLRGNVFDEECIRITDGSADTVVDLDEVTIHDLEEVRLMTERARHLRIQQMQMLANSLLPESSIEFIVQCTKGTDEKFGLDVEWNDEATLMIRSVLPGPAKKWNLQNPYKKLEVGDIITSINHVTGDVDKLLEQLQSNKIYMTVKKAASNLPSATSLGVVAREYEDWSTWSGTNEVAMSDKNVASELHVAEGDPFLIREAPLDNVLSPPIIEEGPAEAVCPSNPTSSTANEDRDMKTSSSTAEGEDVEQKATPKMTACASPIIEEAPAEAACLSNPTSSTMNEDREMKTSSSTAEREDVVQKATPKMTACASPLIEEAPAEAVCPSNPTSSTTNEDREMKTSSSTAERQDVEQKATPKRIAFASPIIEQAPAEAMRPSNPTSSTTNEDRAMKSSSSTAEREDVKQKKAIPKRTTFALFSCMCPCTPLNLGQLRPLGPSVAEIKKVKQQEQIPKPVQRTYL